MLAVERRRLIAESIRSRGVVSVAEMAEALGTTEITLRRDLRVMAREGLLVRTHGGAIRPASLGHEPSYSEKAQQAATEKAAIARVARAWRGPPGPWRGRPGVWWGGRPPQRGEGRQVPEGPRRAGAHADHRLEGKPVRAGRDSCHWGRGQGRRVGGACREPARDCL